MEILSPVLEQYLEKHTDAEPALLQSISRETHLRVLKPHMLSGHYQGRLLSFLSKLISPRRIIEVGTYTAYASICLAEGLTADGLLYTLESNPELEPLIRKNIAVSGLGEKIVLKIGTAAETIATLDETFDLAFIDADKKNNLLYFQLLLDKMRAGGLILIDNVLWKGRVLEAGKDKDTQQICTLNETISADERIEKLILPVRDGLLLIRKKQV